MYKLILGIFGDRHRQIMRWKIRCTGPVHRAQHLENKRGKRLGSFPSLSANQMNGPALPGIFVGADGTSLLGPDEKTKMGVSEANGHSID